MEKNFLPCKEFYCKFLLLLFFDCLSWWKAWEIIIFCLIMFVENFENSVIISHCYLLDNSSSNWRIFWIIVRVIGVLTLKHVCSLWNPVIDWFDLSNFWNCSMTFVKGVGSVCINLAFMYTMFLSLGHLSKI